MQWYRVGRDRPLSEIGADEEWAGAPERLRTRTFGVVTPTLNAERFVDLTLRSVWRQQGDGIEVDHVIVDGGSHDGTLEIASRYPSRAVVAKDDQGMYDAINRGMNLVRGDIVGYINADDEIAPGAFQTVAAAFDGHPDVQWICGRVEYIDGTGKVLGAMTPVRPALNSYVGIGWSCIPQQTVWVRRSFFERVGPFDSTFRHCGDYDWYVRALKVAPPLVLPVTLGRFRLHGEQLSFDPDAMEREARMVQDRHGGRTAIRYLRGRLLSLRLNARNPRWLVAKKTGRIKFTV
jgi:glycosyltransferase involved in cell wall biosynthesis